MVNCLQRVSLISCLLVLFSCAQIVAPTGGPKDTLAPNVIEYSPQNGSVNFNAKNIEIEFDEFLVLKQLKENLISSPPLEYNIGAKTKGKKLILSIKDTLRENTTYVLNFGNSITDLAENNPIKNFQYVFSTGPNLDSLIITGKVIDAFNLKVEEEMLVLLYDANLNDSAFQTQLPNYVSRTDKNGNFILSNIKEGDYNIYALKDANNNYQYDRPDERIAFLDTTIFIDSTLREYTLKTFEAADKKQFVETKEEEKTSLFLKFKQEVFSFNYEVLEQTIKPIAIDLMSDTVQIWWPEQDELEVDLIIATDDFVDTIEVTIDSLTAESKLLLSSTYSTPQNYFSSIPLQFNRPIMSIDSQFIKVQSQSGRNIPFFVKKDTAKLSRAQVNFNSQEDSIYIMQLYPNSFTDIYGRTMDTTLHQLTFNTPEDFGELTLILEGTSSSTKIIQLLNNNGVVIRSATTKNNSVTFKNLSPSSYQVKLIEDINENGKWDSGDFLIKKQPERTFVFEEKINIRKNWDKEVRWILK